MHASLISQLNTHKQTHCPLTQNKRKNNNNKNHYSGILKENKWNPIKQKKKKKHKKM